MPKHPVPSEASDFRFLTSASAPDHAVLEIDTPSNPVRVFLSRDQIEPPEWLPTKWIRLTAGNREDAEKEAADLGRKFDAEFYKKRKQAGVAFNRDAHFKNWTRSHGKLRRAVARLARLKATTVEGLNVKALVIAIAHDAFDDPNIWNEPLQKSITRDIKSMAGGADLAAQVERW